jgi:3-deoxy-7-phosphoheptulonate synthase
LVEVHPNPAKAWSDGDQSLDFNEFDDMMAALDPYLALRELGLVQRESAGLRPMEAVG